MFKRLKRGLKNIWRSVKRNRKKILGSVLLLAGMAMVTLSVGTALPIMALIGVSSSHYVYSTFGILSTATGLQMLNHPEDQLIAEERRREREIELREHLHEAARRGWSQQMGMMEDMSLMIQMAIEADEVRVRESVEIPLEDIRRRLDEIAERQSQIFAGDAVPIVDVESLQLQIGRIDQFREQHLEAHAQLRQQLVGLRAAGTGTEGAWTTFLLETDQRMQRMITEREGLIARVTELVEGFESRVETMTAGPDGRLSPPTRRADVVAVGDAQAHVRPVQIESGASAELDASTEVGHSDDEDETAPLLGTMHDRQDGLRHRLHPRGAFK